MAAMEAPQEPTPRDTETRRTIIVRLAMGTHKALRIRVAEQDTSIQQWVEALIERELGLKGRTDKAPGAKRSRS